MKKLNKWQRVIFIKKYMPEWKDDIKEVYFFKDKKKKIYFINQHYFIIDDNGVIIEKDLQEFDFLKK